MVAATHPALPECLRAGLLRNDARLTGDTDARRVEGNPTEAALLVSAHTAGLYHAAVGEQHPRLDAILFESRHQFMATRNHSQAEDARHVYLKGSVESILGRCDSAFGARLRKIPVSAAAIHAQVEDMAGLGQRVLTRASAVTGQWTTTPSSTTRCVEDWLFSACKA